MSQKATLIKAVNDIYDKQKKPVLIQQIYSEVGCDDTRLSNKMFSHASAGLVKKVKVGTANGYQPTTKGRKYVSDTPFEVFWTKNEWDSWSSGLSGNTIRGSGDQKISANKTPKLNGRLSSEAMSAIDSISEIIQKNDQLTNTLRSIQSQINFVLSQPSEDDAAEVQE